AHLLAATPACHWIEYLDLAARCCKSQRVSWTGASPLRDGRGSDWNGTMRPSSATPRAEGAPAIFGAAVTTVADRDAGVRACTSTPSLRRCQPGAERASTRSPWPPVPSTRRSATVCRWLCAYLRIRMAASVLLGSVG